MGQSNDSSSSRGLRLLRRAASRLDLDDETTAAAADIYERAVSAGLLKGRRTDDMVAGSLHAGAKQTNTPVAAEEVAEAVADGVDRRKALRASKVIVREEGLDPLLDIEEYVERIVDRLDVPELESRAKEIARESQRRRNVGGKNPHSVAGAAVYLAGREDGVCTQAEVADAANVSTVTIRTRCHELEGAAGGGE